MALKDGVEVEALHPKFLRLDPGQRWSSKYYLGNAG